jgi:hypothetical protein
MRENAEAKGRRYATEARLLIDHVDGRTIRARCRGNGAIYELGYDGERWYCDCKALGRCSHLVALQLVTVPARASDT